jgi:hypothetical protein
MEGRVVNAFDSSLQKGRSVTGKFFGKERHFTSCRHLPSKPEAEAFNPEA